MKALGLAAGANGCSIFGALLAVLRAYDFDLCSLAAGISFGLSGALDWKEMAVKTSVVRSVSRMTVVMSI